MRRGERMPEDRLSPHGTRPRYRHHLAWGEVPCQACCDGEAAASRAYRQNVVLRAMEVTGRPMSFRQAARTLREVSRG